MAPDIDDVVMLFPFTAGLQLPGASLGTVTFSLTTFGQHVTGQLLSLCKQLLVSCPVVGAERSPGTEKLGSFSVPGSQCHCVRG